MPSPPTTQPSDPEVESPITRKRKRSSESVERGSEKHRKASPSTAIAKAHQSAEKTSAITQWAWDTSCQVDLTDPSVAVPSSHRRSSSSLRDVWNQGDQREKSEAYRSSLYPEQLKRAGIYLKGAESGIEERSKLCETLLNTSQEHPRGSCFADDVFSNLCDMMENKDEAWLVREITQYVVPSAELLSLRESSLRNLTTLVNEQWGKILPLVQPIPWPDFSAGFGSCAFTPEQLQKLKPLARSTREASLIAPTAGIYFPFLVCEVKAGLESLDVADRQNANSASVAVRAVLELYGPKRAELHGKILAFSVSHDDKSARLYGHFALIDDDRVTYYRHTISCFYFREKRWTAWQFVRNVYSSFSPTLLEILQEGVDRLPDPLPFSPPQSSATESLDDSQSYESELPASPIQELAGSQKRPRNNLLEKVRSR